MATLAYDTVKHAETAPYNALDDILTAQYDETDRCIRFRPDCVGDECDNYDSCGYTNVAYIETDLTEEEKELIRKGRQERIDDPDGVITLDEFIKKYNIKIDENRRPPQIIYR